VGQPSGWILTWQQQAQRHTAVICGLFNDTTSTYEYTTSNRRFPGVNEENQEDPVRNSKTCSMSADFFDCPDIYATAMIIIVIDVMIVFFH